MNSKSHIAKVETVHNRLRFIYEVSACACCKECQKLSKISHSGRRVHPCVDIGAACQCVIAVICLWTCTIFVRQIEHLLLWHTFTHTHRQVEKTQISGTTTYTEKNIITQVVPAVAMVPHFQSHDVVLLHRYQTFSFFCDFLLQKLSTFVVRVTECHVCS